LGLSSATRDPVVAAESEDARALRVASASMAVK
jgi:hypothetical protein